MRILNKSVQIGGDRQRIDAIIKDVREKYTLTDADTQSTDKLIRSLGQFKESLDQIVRDIKELDSMAQEIEPSDYQAAHKAYTDFTVSIAKLRDLRPLSNAGYVTDDQPGELEDFSVLYEIYRPLIASYQMIRDARDAQDMASVYAQIEKQTDINISAIDSIESLVDSLVHKIRQSNQIKFPNYAFNRTDTHVEYTIDDEKYTIQLVPDGKTVLRTIEFLKTNNPVIHADSLELLKEYANLAKETEYADISVEFDRDTESAREQLIALNKIDGMRKTQTGGAEPYDHTVYSRLYEFVDRMGKLNRKLESFQRDIDHMYMNSRHKKHYLMYMAQIATMSDVQALSIYDAIDYDTLSKYNTIVQNILSKIRSGSTDIDVLYFETYSYYVLLRMANWITPLINKLEKSDVLDLISATGELKSDITIFNRYKDILDNYSKEFL